MLMLMLGCHRYVATELPLRYRKLVANKSKCYVVVAGLWTAALVTFFAPLLTKPNAIYYRYNVNQKMCGLHWEYPSQRMMPLLFSAQLLSCRPSLTTMITILKTRTKKETRDVKGR